METRMLTAAVLATVALIASVQAGNGHHSNGGNVVSGRSGAVRSGGSSFSSMPARSFSGNRIYSGQRFSSFGPGSSNVTRFRPQTVNSNFGARQLARQNFGANRLGQIGNNSRIVRSGNGNGFARNNNLIRNRTGAGQFRNGNRLASNWRSHVVAQHSATWHRDWDRHHDHFFHGNRFVFIDGFWWGFGLGFDPWWWGDYPYYGYGYGYPYNYGYGYNYDNGSSYDNGYDSGYTDPGPDNQSYNDPRANRGQDGSQNNYGAQSANSSVAAAQERLSRDGFYNGGIDGVLGPETRHALVRFQTKHGLRISGELTTETLDALGLQQYANSGFN
jgi:Putative peptidoglycan binding domain